MCMCVFPVVRRTNKAAMTGWQKKRERKVTFIILRLLQRRKWSHFIVLWGDVITWHDDLLFSDWCDDTWETHIGPDKFFPSVWSRHFTLYFCVWSRKWANRVTARSCCCCFFISLYFFAVIIRILYSLPKKGFSFFFFSLVYINRRVFGPDRMSITRSASFGFFHLRGQELFLYDQQYTWYTTTVRQRER